VDQKGQTLLETIVAIAAVALVVIGLVKGLTLSLKNVQFAKERSSARNYAQEAGEWLVFQRDSSWDNLSLGAYCLNGLNWDVPGDDHPENCSGFILDSSGGNTVYKRNAVLSEVVLGREVAIMVNVYWDSPRGGETFSLNFNLTKWK